MSTIKPQFSKLPNQAKTIFAIMSELAGQHNAIDLSRGYPNFSVDQTLIDLYCKYLNEGYNQYAPVFGLMELREKVAQKTEKQYGSIFNPDTEITITGGATEAIFTAITAFIKDGDEVIILEPAYDMYTPAVKINGGIPVFVELEAPKYHVNWEQVQKAITGNTRMIIINNPQNPTGNVFSAWDIEKLKKLVNGTNIVILSDEVYEHMVFDGMDHESVLSFDQLKNRSIVVNSFGKTFHATGWRLGYVQASKDLMNEFRKVHQYSMYTTNTPAQYALNEYLETYNNYAEIKQLFEKKRDLFLSYIKPSKFEYVDTMGTYFQNLNYSNLSDESDFEFAAKLIREYKVASIPVSHFYKAKNDYHMLRFCFAKTDDTLKKAGEILAKL